MTTDQQKKQKYQPLHNTIIRHLPRTWKGEILTLSVGVRGTVVEEQWEQTLEKLGVPAAGRERIMKAAVATTLTELDKILQAHLSHRGRPPDGFGTINQH